MRKILTNRDQFNLGVVKKRIQETCDRSRGIVADEYINLVEEGVKKLDATVEGIGAIDYYGNPVIRQNVSGLGKVNEADLQVETAK